MSGPMTDGGRSRRVVQQGLGSLLELCRAVAGNADGLNIGMLSTGHMWVSRNGDTPSSLDGLYWKIQ